MGGSRRAHAETVPEAGSALLRPRRLAIPFDTVWQAARNVLDGGIRKWSLDHSDDHEGLLTGTCRGMGSSEHTITVRVALDADAQTTVDASVTAKEEGRDFGRAERRLRRFLGTLDKALARSGSASKAGRS
jgi:hypothetical protein